MLMQDKDLIVYVYVEDESTGKTVGEIRIPIIARPKPSSLYTPEQINNYSTVMGDLEGALEQVEDLADRAEDLIPLAETWANATATAFELEAGSEPTVTYDFDGEGNRTIAFGIPSGKDGSRGKAFQILGVFDTYDLLIQSVDSPEQGDHYDVGPDENGQYTMYMFDTKKGWVNKGIMQGGGTGDGTVVTINGVEANDEGEVVLRSDNIMPSDDDEVVDGYVYIPVVADDSQKLGGVDASEYAKKEDLNNGQPGSVSGVPNGGSQRQTLVKQSDKDGDAQWEHLNVADLEYVDPEDEQTVEENRILVVHADDSDKLGGKLPSEYALADHTHENMQPNGSQPVVWESIENKPKAYPPESHEHEEYENKVKSISVNGEQIEPDENGNVDLGELETSGESAGFTGFIRLSFALPASGWAKSETGRYTHLYENADITEYTQCSSLDVDMSEVTEDTIDAVKKARSCIDKVDTVNGGILFTSYKNAPTIDLNMIADVVTIQTSIPNMNGVMF